MNSGMVQFVTSNSGAEKTFQLFVMRQDKKTCIGGGKVGEPGEAQQTEERIRGAEVALAHALEPTEAKVPKDVEAAEVALKKVHGVAGYIDYIKLSPVRNSPRAL
ncbi:hypothetical protein PHYSODRAFT_336878 [Phytophthora sojae]|uniref:Uncharacterized protein n=1 Tax=Phytophthora sojae (strain P6497) TaxID=1094619 RepID=G4ZWS7_PHYSP|nr:hypothetical protein PHYSODRAFT_336878 [Phytophthora sojae]EGZ12451.1 hypothetical protein PHYSODRAFT_336878 [Phytophthora sojae]|eukprot:XP_009532784.1 hypothetical protein PHYSODRAFT_336878 [Phytophthora sojae]